MVDNLLQAYPIHPSLLLTIAVAKSNIHASQGFSISLSFSTQLQHRQTTTNMDAVYIIVSTSASSIQ